MIYYSGTNRAFYDSEFLPAGGLPEDAVNVTTDLHADLLAAQASGMLIVPAENGQPMAVPAAPPDPRVLRLAAYRAESDQLYLAAVYDGTIAAMDAWRAKVEEIKARYPLNPNESES